MKSRNFDQDAASWDESPTRVALAADVTRSLLRHLPLTSSMDILDFGCGTGLVSLPFAGQVRSLTGMDSSRGMLDVFDAKLRQQKIGNAHSALFDSTSAGILPGRYHAIVSSMALHHVEDVDSLLGKFFEALLPGGFLAIADLDQEGGRFHENHEGVFHNGFDRQRLSTSFLQSGFIQVQGADAALVRKPGSDGQEAVFSVFIMTARKP